MKTGFSFTSLAFFPSRRQVLWALGLLSYALVLILIFLYLTFPYQKAEARLIALLEETLLCRIQVGESERLFPLGLAWRQVSLSPQEGLPGDLRLDHVAAEVRLWPLLSRRVEMDILVRAYGGDAQGLLVAQRRDGKIQYRLEETAQNLDLEALGKDLALGLGGRLRMTLETAWEDENILQSVGAGQIELLEARLQPGRVRGIELPDLPFLRVAGQFQLRNGLLTLQDFQAEGPLVDAMGGGTLLLRNRMADGILNFSADLGVKEELQRKFPLMEMISNGTNPVKVSIKGTIRRPLISVNGISLNL